MDSIADYGTKRNLLTDLTVGDYIECEYTATSGIAGIFANLGSATKTLLPVSGSSVPDGKFNFICVERKPGKGGLCIADRPIQSSISWDILNAGGLIEGKSYKKNILPIFNSYTSGIFTASEYGPYTSDYNFVKALDGDPISFRCGQQSGFPHWVQVKSTSLINASKLRLRSSSGGGNGYLSNITIVGLALNNSETTIIANSTAINAYNIDFDFTIPSNTYYGIKVYINATSIGTYGSLSKFELLGEDKYLIRSMSGGDAYSDANGKYSTTDTNNGAYPTNNEWDTHIVKSTLGGKITAGDNNIWNWSNGASYNWVKETPAIGIAANTNRVMRGAVAVTTLTPIRLSSNTYEGMFRPVLEFAEDGTIFI